MEETWQQVECLDEGKVELAWLRRRLAHRPRHEPPIAQYLRQAYEEETGMVIGCD
jgi:hypothetical protein